MYSRIEQCVQRANVGLAWSAVCVHEPRPATSGEVVVKSTSWLSNSSERRGDVEIIGSIALSDGFDPAPHGKVTTRRGATDKHRYLCMNYVHKCCHEDDSLANRRRRLSYVLCAAADHNHSRGSACCSSVSLYVDRYFPSGGTPDAVEWGPLCLLSLPKFRISVPCEGYF